MSNSDKPFQSMHRFLLFDSRVGMPELIGFSSSSTSSSSTGGRQTSSGQCPYLHENLHRRLRSTSDGINASTSPSNLTAGNSGSSPCSRHWHTVSGQNPREHVNSHRSHESRLMSEPAMQPCPFLGRSGMKLRSSSEKACRSTAQSMVPAKLKFFQRVCRAFLLSSSRYDI